MPATILFVCTGNICRSPLAEAAAAAALTEYFGMEDLTAVGLRVASSGTHGLAGYPATDEMRLVGAELGFDLSTHRATRLNRPLVYRSSLIFAMEDEHLAWLRRGYPDGRGVLLGQAAIDDPYGKDLAAYRLAAREIVAGVARRIPEMAALAG